MNNMCELCGRTESEAMADAKALGLQEEFQNGLYTCCQVADWADEQALAWFDAAHADSQGAEYVAPEQSQPEPVFVFVRARRPHVPWYRNPDDRS
jgi:hypothetical protein